MWELAVVETSKYNIILALEFSIIALLDCFKVFIDIAIATIDGIKLNNIDNILILSWVAKLRNQLNIIIITFQKHYSIGGGK